MEYNHMNVFWGFLKYKRVTGNTPDLRCHLQAAHWTLPMFSSAMRFLLTKKSGRADTEVDDL